MKTKTSKRKFYRYVYRYEVLSEDPLADASLSELQSLCDEGPCVGRFLENEEKKLTAKQAVKALYDTGSEPGFFQLNEKGEDEDWV